MDSKKSYVRYISHELRTPLSAAFLGLKLLTTDLKASRDPRDVERYDTLYDINMSCVAAVDILNDLLCYDKLGSGSLELHKEEIIVESYLQSSLSMFTAQANESGVTLSFAPQSNNHDNTQNGAFRVLGINRIFLPLHVTDLIIADKFKIDQVLRNVISNALKFTSRGGSVTLSVSFMPDIITATPSPVMLYKPKIGVKSGLKSRDRTDTSLSNMTKEKTRKKKPYKWFRSSSAVHCETVIDDSIYGMVVIIITDTGAGISIENQSKLFEEIVQFSPEKLQAGGGSGLGLWISSGILEMHNGKISVFSEGEGHGCSFTIQIPMTRQQSTLISPIVSTIPPPLYVTAVTRAYNNNDNNYDITNNSNDCNSDPNNHDNDNNNNNDENNCNENNDNDKSIGEGEGDEFESNDNYDIYTDKPLCTYCPSPNLNNNTSEDYQLPPLELLVIDDSPVNCKMLMKCLKAVGHSCVSGSDGLMAIAMVKERIDFVNGGNGRPYDAILMDFMMPNMDGPSATKIIRSMGYTAPILGLTGNG